MSDENFSPPTAPIPAVPPNDTLPKNSWDLKIWLWPVSLFLTVLVIAGAWVYTSKQKNQNLSNKNISSIETALTSELEQKVIPLNTTLPVVWGDLGKKLVASGALDLVKFQDIYANRGGLDEASLALLKNDNNGQIEITPANSGLWLNLLWALGLANKNAILDKGPMSDPQYGGAGNFASTGGWTIATGTAMDHYSRHDFIKLSPEQELLVAKVAQNIYRPCCDNSTLFPDCNHGMAMLGLLELLASQGKNEEQMYQTALTVNSYWFPENYLTIARYLQENGQNWDQVKPQEILGANYSSSTGYQNILNKTVPVSPKPSPGCGV